MAEEPLARCEGCGDLFVVNRARTGPARRYCGKGSRCRQRAYRDRARLEVAVEAADLAADLSHSQLAEAFADLPASVALRLRKALEAIA